MPFTIFAAPILPGKTEMWKQAVKEITGPRIREFEDANVRMGITRHAASLQVTPSGDFVVVYIEGDDPDSVIGKYFSSDHPYDRWFAQTVLKGVHGMDVTQQPPPPTQAFVDWKQ